MLAIVIIITLTFLLNAYNMFDSLEVIVHLELINPIQVIHFHRLLFEKERERESEREGVERERERERERYG